jgi:outer membrane protein TolC
MWVRLALVEVGCLALGFLHAPAALADDLTLPEAIRLAHEYNEDSKIADKRVEIAEGEVESSRAAFLPTLTLGASAQADAREDARGRHVTGSSSLTLRQPLLRPSAIPNYRASKVSLDAAKANGSEDQRAVAFDTARAYVKAVAAESVLQASQGRLDRAKADFDDVKARVEAELVSSNDLTRERLDVSSAQKGVFTSQSSLQRARLDLALLIGKAVDGALVPPGALSDAAENFTGDDDSLRKVALDKRVDLKAAHLQTLAARIQSEEPNYRLIPSIDLTGQITANPDPGDHQPWDDETLTVSLTWTIFDGGARYGDRRSRSAQADIAELSEKRLGREIDNDVATALVELDTAKDAYRVAKESVDAARANSDETGTLYDQGLARAIELTDANASLFDAEVGLAQARLDLVNAYLDVRAALGEEPMPGGNGAAR